MENWVVPSGVKKWVFTFFLVVFLFLSFALTTTASTGMMGDVNGDGVIDVRDSVMVMRHALGLQSLSTSQRLLADVNGDGLINVADVNLITQRTLGLISHFPVSDLYTVSFNGNGGLPVQQTRTARHGETMLSTFGSMPASPSRGGFNFSGWNTRADGLGTWFAVHTPVYSNLNLYAQWQPITQEHTISFNANGGTPSLQTRIVMNGESLGTMPGAMPTPPMRTGYIFTGWNTRSDGMGSWFTSSTVVYASSTVYAQWQLLTTTHIVSFNGNGGSPALQTRTARHGDTMLSTLGSMPTSPIRWGFDFSGWNTRVDGLGTWFAVHTPVYSNLNLYAQWQPITQEHTISFNANGGTPSLQTRVVMNGASLGTMPGAMPTPPMRTGYIFTGWNARSDGMDSWFTSSTVVYASSTVYAQWQPLTTTHIVSFNGNGGSPALQTRTVSHGGSLGIMPSNPILLGVQFIGWNTMPDGSGTTFTFWTPVYGDLIVYAQWQVVSLSHTVTFNGYGGTPATQTRTVSHGESLGLTPGAMPLPPSRTGFTFNGWNTHWTGVGSSFTHWTAVGEDIIVYAVWSF